MAAELFYTNCAMVCHNCRRTAVARLEGSPGKFRPLSDEKEVLEVHLVSCGVCLDLPHVYDPLSALLSKFVDLGSYEWEIKSLEYIFNCTPRIEQVNKFSLKEFKLQRCSAIREITAIIDVSDMPAANIMILKGGCELLNDCKFFRHEARRIDRQILRYPISSDHNAEDMPFASVAYRPSIIVSIVLPPEFCAEDVLPAYSARAMGGEEHASSVPASRDAPRNETNHEYFEFS